MINLLLWNIPLIVFLGIFKKLKIKKDGYEKKTVAFVMLCVLIYCMIPIGIDYLNGEYPKAYFQSNLVSITAPTEDREDVGELIKGREIQQTFYSNYSYLQSIQLYILCYGRKNEGTLYVSLYNNTDDEIFDKWEIDLSEIGDEEFLTLNIDNPVEHNAMDKNFTISISVDADYSNSITLLQVPDKYGYGNLIIDGEETKSDLVFKIIGYKNTYNMERARIWICFTVLFLTEIAIGIICKKES